MIINEKRALAYTAKIEWVKPIEGADNIELVGVLGWPCIAKIGEFHEGDQCVYFEIDSKVPAADWSAFLESKHYKIKTMKLGKFGVFSQGLALPFDAFDANLLQKIIDATTGGDEHVDLTDVIGVTYSVEEDNKRKANAPDPNAKYMSMKARHKKFFSKKWVKKLMKYEWFRKFIFIFLGKKKDNPKTFPTNFPGVSKTDQERCENMPWILNDKTPFIVTQKCDGSSGTYILERKKHNKFEFYVCSRNVRMVNENQECFYGTDNFYWEVAHKYEIEKKMREWLNNNPEATFICWQGEICAPKIQSNPHKLTQTHFYCFHWTDSLNGRRDIRDACADWEKMEMEHVPIVNTNYIMPDDFEEFKLSADGTYDSSVCEGKENCPREGFVYYKTSDPAFSFKNVSRIYLLKHNN